MTRQQGAQVFNLYAALGFKSQPTLRLINLDDASQVDIRAKFESSIADLDAADVEDFEAGYSADPGVATRIENYELPAGFQQLLKASTATALPELNPSEVEEAGLRALIGVRWNGVKPAFIAVQRVDARHVLSPHKMWFGFVEGDTFTRLTQPAFQVPEDVDAVYQDGTLLIRNWIRTDAVLDLSAWNRMASFEETDTFLNDGPFEVPADFSLEVCADQVVRRKVAGILASKVLDNCTVKQLQTYATKCGISFAVRKRRIVVPTNKRDFKALISYLNQDMLFFPPTDEMWITNSKKLARKGSSGPLR
jgi:hypothetical protein